MSRSHSAHQHASPHADWRLLTAALVLIVTFMIVEVVIGAVIGSLALLSDAAHMLTDAASLVLAILAMRLAVRPPRGGYTYGLTRAEIASAHINGVSLLVLAGWLGVVAVQRLFSTPEVPGTPVLITACAGIAVNLLATWLIGKANRASLNIAGAYAHILNDLFAFIATAVAGVVIVLTGFVQADAIATLIVVVLMVVAGLRLVRDSGRIFLEAAPPGIDPGRLGAELVAMPAVAQVHDLHVWSISSQQPALSAHVIVDDGADCHALRQQIQHWLIDAYGIEHSVLQVDHAADIDDSAVHCTASHGPTHY
ncbi:MAG: cation diffusion facilitator family transporter, partial [Mycobacteriales bacterium]